MDIRKIKKLIEMLQESDLNEIEVSQGEESVRISRGNNNTVSTQIPLSNNPIKYLRLVRMKYSKSYLEIKSNLLLLEHFTEGLIQKKQHLLMSVMLLKSVMLFVL
jgi:hypothetical protein